MKQARFIHTADWHIRAQYLYNDGDNRRKAFARAVEKMVRVAIKHKVDRFVICGDIFDNDNPHAELLQLFLDLIAPLRAAGIVVIVLAGNHDTKYSKSENGNNVSVQPIKTLADNITLRVYTNADGVVTERVNGHTFAYVPWQRDLQHAIDGIETKGGTVLFTHGATLGALADNGHKMREGELSPRNLAQFKFVALGDFHTPQFVQQKKYGKKILYSGSPIRNTWNDRYVDRMAALCTVGTGVKVQRIALPDVPFLQWEFDTLTVYAVREAMEQEPASGAYIRIHSDTAEDGAMLAVKNILYDEGAYDVQFYTEKETKNSVIRSVMENNDNIDALSFCIHSVEDEEDAQELQDYIKAKHEQYQAEREI